MGLGSVAQCALSPGPIDPEPLRPGPAGHRPIRPGPMTLTHELLLPNPNPDPNPRPAAGPSARRAGAARAVHADRTLGGCTASA